MKELVVKTIAFGRAHQSKHTGFFHYCFEETTSHETIPILENLLFAFALFSSHTQIQMLEAKDILTKLLKFQLEEGTFPFYLHEYPVCKKPLANVKVLLALFAISQKYGGILGSEVKSALRLSIDKLSTALDKLEPMPPVLAFQKKAFDHIYKNGEKPQFLEAIVSSSMWAEYAYGAALLGYEIDIPWHEEYHRYAGPLIAQKTKEFRPQPTIFDLLLNSEKGVDDPILLHALLAMEGKFLPKKAESDREWEFSEEKGFHLGFLREYSFGKELTFGLHLFEFFNETHSFACQETAMKHVAIYKKEKGFEAIFTLPEKVDEDGTELSFFVNNEPKIFFLVNGVRATCFALQDSIQLVIGEQKVDIAFEIVEGKGEFVGHLSYGNRPSQISKKVKEEYAAFDWKLSLRTLTRESHLVLKIRVIF